LEPKSDQEPRSLDARNWDLKFETQILSSASITLVKLQNQIEVLLYHC